MSQELEASIVQIITQDKRISGLGVLVTETEILTTPLVIADILGEEVLKSQDNPQGEIHLNFPLIAPNEILTAQVILWDTENGIAGLDLNTPSPINAQTTTLIKEDNLWGHTFKSFGFIRVSYNRYIDGKIDYMGMWTKGTIFGPASNKLIHLETVVKEHEINPYFRGTPIWDDQESGVVGIIVGFYFDGGLKLAFMLPTEQILQAWPKLRQRYRPTELKTFQTHLQQLPTPSTDKNEQYTYLNTLTKQFCSLIPLPAPVMGKGQNAFYGGLVDIGAIIGELNLPPNVPWIYYTGTGLREDELADLRTTINHHLRSSHSIAFLVLLNEDALSTHSKNILQKMQTAYAYDLILFGLADLKALVEAESPRVVLKQRLLAQVSLKTISPFVITGPVPDRMFFSREQELRDVSDHIATTNYALIGGRRIGKTSILQRLQQKRLPLAGFSAYYHDCSYTPTEVELVKAISLNKRWGIESKQPLTTFVEVIHHLTTPKKTAEEIGAEVNDKEKINLSSLSSPKKPLVILFDEVDALIPADQERGYALFNAMRSLSNAGVCHFVLGGERVLRGELSNPDSPLYNFANALLISRLDFEAVEELITRPMTQLEIEMPERMAIVEQVWQFTSGHPNVVQRFCQRLIMQLNQRNSRCLTLDDVEAVASDPDFLRKDFLNVYWERATPLERLCSLLMAADETLNTLTAIHATLSKRKIEATLNEVDAALERLVDLRNILGRTATGYNFAVKAFPEVIAKTNRLKDWLDLSQEFYQAQNNNIYYTANSIPIKGEKLHDLNI